MQFTLNKANLNALLKGFRQDKLAKGVRKVDAHGLNRLIGTFEASGATPSD